LTVADGRRGLARISHHSLRFCAGRSEGPGFTGCGKTLHGCHPDPALREKDLALRIFLKMHRARFFSRKAGSE
jgi:hypothetical protein